MRVLLLRHLAHEYTDRSRANAFALVAMQANAMHTERTKIVSGSDGGNGTANNRANNLQCALEV